MDKRWAPAILVLLSPSLYALGHNFQKQTWQSESGLPQNTVRAIAQTRDGYMWFGTEGGLVRFDGLKFTAFESFRGTFIRALREADGFLWVYTSGGLFRYDGKAFQSVARGQAIQESGEPVVQRPFPETGLKTGRIFTSLQTRDGTVWAGCEAGLVRMSPAQPELIPLSGDGVIALFEDREGNLWAGTDSDGVTVLRDLKFATYTSDLTRCVYQDRSGAMWLGTSKGLRQVTPAGETSFTAAEGLSSNLVYALGETAQGDLLAGTQDGLNLIHHGKVTVLTTADGLPDDLVRSLHTDADGSVWMGTRRGLTVWRNGSFQTYTEANGLSNDFVGALLRDRQGVLWIATRNGLASLRGGAFQTFMKGSVITALFEDAARTHWIGTEEAGLHRLRAGKIEQLNIPALPSAVYGISESAGSLWVTSKTGIFRITGQTAVQYSTADGLRVNECSQGGHPAALHAKDGSLWFATLRGAASIDPDAMRPSVAPLVALTGMTVDGQSVDLPSEIAPGHERLSFEYTGLSFASPQRVRFRFRLDGFDRDWVDAGARRAAYYTSLAPGSYRFQVMAQTYDGVWSSNQATTSFRLLPRFYQTYWFYLLCLAALSAAVYGAYRYRVREVESKFNAVLAERNRIAREIHDTLAQTFVAVSLQLELLSRKIDASSAAVQIVERARQMVQTGLAEARRSIWDLRSQEEQAGDLRSRLSNMTAGLASQSGLKAEFRVLGAFRVLPENVESELFKIAQEAVTNAVRHAAAQQVQVNLAYQGKRVRLTVSDDGRGFEGPAPDGHYGLRGMRERAVRIGAELQVKSSLGNGTQIDVEKIVP